MMRRRAGEYRVPVEDHNALISRLEEHGFTLSENKLIPSPLRIGSIQVTCPRADHPTMCDEPLPVAYIDANCIRLSNKEEPILRQYHNKLIELIEG